MVYYYKLAVYFSLYHVLKRTFLTMIFQSHFAYFALVILTYVTYDRNQGKLEGGGGAVLISGEKREKHDGFCTFNMHCQLMTALPLAKN